MTKVNNYTLEQYKQGDYLVDIIDKGNEYEAWVYQKNSDSKMFMFGAISVQQYGQTKKQFQDLVNLNIDNYITLYAEQFDN